MLGCHKKHDRYRKNQAQQHKFKMVPESFKIITGIATYHSSKERYGGPY